MFKFAIQFLEPSPDIETYDPNLVRKKLRIALSLLPISIVIVGWKIPEKLREICRAETDASGVQLYRWQPLLTSDGVLQIKEENRVIGLDGRPIPAYMNMPSFTFMCPNNPSFEIELIKHLENAMASSMYDGFFLDRMRFPAITRNIGESFGCFCPHCMKSAAESGFDLYKAQGEIKKILNSHQGKINFIKNLTKPDIDINISSDQIFLQNFLTFRAKSIHRIVNKAAKLAKSLGLKTGLDCFSPSVSFSVGQDMKMLNDIGDWFKPMTYLHTFAPAGLPFELNEMLEILRGSQKENVPGRYTFLSQVTNLTIPSKQSILMKRGLISTALANEISKAKKRTSKPLFAGIELVSIDGVTWIDNNQLIEDMRQLKESSAEGIVISWDLWQIKMEHLNIIKDAFL